MPAGEAEGAVGVGGVEDSLSGVSVATSAAVLFVRVLVGHAGAFQLAKPRLRAVWVGSRARCRGCPSRLPLPSSFRASLVNREGDRRVPGVSVVSALGC